MRAWAVVSVVIAGCSSDPFGHVCEDYTPPPGFDATTPKVQFARDVMPVFERSCAFSSCHGQMNNPNGVYLGSSSKDVYASLVGQKSPELPTMHVVTAGDPNESYLMRKMDGSQCVFEGKCTDGSCQDSMPKDESVLDTATRDIVRRWILQGAQND